MFVIAQSSRMVGELDASEGAAAAAAAHFELAIEAADQSGDRPFCQGSLAVGRGAF